MSADLADAAAFARRLDDARISYHLAFNRADALMFSVAVPGERWEVEFMESGDVEVEIFSGNGRIFDASKLTDLFDQHT